LPLSATGLLVAFASCTSREGAGRTRSAEREEGCPGVAGETISWIVPYSPGGGYDVLSRILEPFLEKAIGAQIVVQNRPGAGGLVGVRTIRDADPDGRTLGIVNGTGLLVVALQEEAPEIDPLRDLTILARLAVSAPVLVTGGDSPWRTIDDVLAGSRDRPLLFGMTDLSSSGFSLMSVASGLLGLDVTYVAGYPGSRENGLGLMRGEIDLAGLTFESIRDRVEAGDLRPLLQISGSLTADEPALRDIPVLAGATGLAARRARELGRDPAEAMAQAEALAHLFDAGRLAVAPAGLDPDLAACLRTRLSDVARDSGFLAAAARAQFAVSFEETPEVVAHLETTAEVRRGLATEIRHQMERVRAGR